MESQLLDQKIPEALWPKLQAKLDSTTFDAGSTFAFADNADEQGLCLVPNVDLDVHADIWLIDHMLTLPQEQSAAILSEQVCHENFITCHTKHFQISGQGLAARTPHLPRTSCICEHYTGMHAAVLEAHPGIPSMLVHSHGVTASFLVLFCVLSCAAGASASCTAAASLNAWCTRSHQYY
jgi:hypothetical protein